MIDARPFIGLPYSDKGQGDSIGPVHCWGLVRLVYRQQGIDLPAFDAIDAADLRAVARTIGGRAASAPWRVVTGPWKPLDVVVMAGRPEPGKARALIHCGVMIDWRRMLHTERETNCVMVRRDDASVRHRIAIVCRHEAIND